MSGQAIRHFVLGNCEVSFLAGGECLTVFKDAASTTSWPHRDDPHYSVISHRCGYDNDLNAYCQEHDFLHSWLSEEMTGCNSPVIWGAAHNDWQHVSPVDCAYEEIFVQTFQRWLRANEMPIVGGIDWVALKNKVLHEIRL